MKWWGLVSWFHQMEIFSPLLGIWPGNSPVTGEFPVQWPVTRSFDVFFDLRLNKRLSKQSWGWWFDTPSRPVWRHCNVCGMSSSIYLRGDIMAWKRRSFMRRINRWPVDSPHKGPVMRKVFPCHDVLVKISFCVLLVPSLNMMLNKQSYCRWFELLRRSNDVTLMTW